MFEAYPKTPRLRNLRMLVTEKIDGTNAQILVRDGAVVLVGSRNRAITPAADNHGFARWVEDNPWLAEALGDGRHFGEWAGPGIQGNPLGLPEKRFFTFRTDYEDPRVRTVPLLAHEPLDLARCEEIMRSLERLGTMVPMARPGARPEGIVVRAMGHAFKMTFDDSHKTAAAG